MGFAGSKRQHVSVLWRFLMLRLNVNYMHIVSVCEVGMRLGGMQNNCVMHG